ncbi:MAG: hypothetical protein LBS71_00645 [Puniceicoccales bacterium]|jgi:hypothetical protein|nr:hypothetical protein [Puniceicoccales bacterium]
MQEAKQKELGCVCLQASTKVSVLKTIAFGIVSGLFSSLSATVVKFTEKEKSVLQELTDAKIQKIVYEKIENMDQDPELKERILAVFGIDPQDILEQVTEKKSNYKKINQDVLEAMENNNIRSLEDIFDRCISEKWRKAEESGNEEVIAQAKIKYNVRSLEKKCHWPTEDHSWLRLAIQKGKTEIVALFWVHDILIFSPHEDEEQISSKIEINVRKWTNIAFNYNQQQTYHFLRKFLKDDESCPEIFKELQYYPVYIKTPDSDPKIRNIQFAQDMTKALLGDAIFESSMYI